MFPQKKMDPLTDGEWVEYKQATVCHICLKEFDIGDKKNYKVRDHCHYTGKYRGAAHNNCNLKYKVPSYIPIVFHNLSGYDAHLFIRELGKKFDTGEINVIAENKEKYISFNVNIVVGTYKNKEGELKDKKIQLRFIDSFRFMASSLDKLSSNLTDDQCKNLRSFYNGDEIFKLMRRKGVYPYEYMDSWEKFEETKLPSKEDFYSRLNMEPISDEDYNHAKKVWERITPEDDETVTLRDYHDVYLTTDVLLLADVFESFRETCIKNYQLDPAHFYTSPGLAWIACLKKTGIELELLSDIDMLLMFEKGIRGGIVQAVHRYAEANNKYMGDMYDQNKESSYLQYLDANNLYGWAMSQPLPTGGFKWIEDVDKFTTKKISQLAKENGKGYILEVDISYPKELHGLHNDLPFMCEKMEINGVSKLVPNLYSKTKYVTHVRELDQALQHGLVLEKVYRVIEFDQSPWMKSYIDMNTKLRMKSRNDFEKDFFKLMNNSVFGKTMENIRNHRDIKLATNEKSYLRHVMKPNFKSGICFSENLMGCELGKTKIVMTKPVYIGPAVLDLSKILMYEFHYEYMKPKYNENVKLCYMDTDSFVYHIKTEDFYKDISDDVTNKFDTSGYTEERPLPVGINKKVIGMFKDELGGKIMTEFCTLRSKMYAYTRLDGIQDKKCKGTKKCVVKKTLEFEDYKKCLFDKDGKDIYRRQLIFENRNHEVFTCEINKVALNKFDDKRIVLEDGVSTLARGICL